MKEIKISGINGYLGTLLAKELNSKGYKVSGIDRKLLYGNSAVLAEEIRGNDILISLAGTNILRRWTHKNKTEIYNSRVHTTAKLVEAVLLLDANERPECFISASAIGIYKSGEVHDEHSQSFDPGFVGKVVQDWEKPIYKLPKPIKSVVFRIAPVLGKQSKTISNLLLPFKMGLGGRIASGKQPFPFVHEKDVVNAFVWAIENRTESVIYNLTAPEHISNASFTKAFARLLKRPALFPVPVFVLKLIYGQAAEVLVESPQALPSALIREGFSFKFPDIHSTLNDILT